MKSQHSNTSTKLSKSWDSYYGNNIPINEKYKNNNYTTGNRITPTKGNAYVYNCYFFDSTTTTSGGSISFEKRGYNLLVEQCSFYNISATYQAAICVFSGNSILAFLCGQHCFSNNNDGFCSIYGDATRTINSVFDSSISRCEAQRENTMAHGYGYVYIKSVNLSHNKANSHSALTSAPELNNEETNHGSDVLYCSFSNNTADSQFCILVNNHHNESCTHQIKNCNIIENNSPKTIYSNGETNIYQCSILNNGNPCFYTEDENSKIIISSSYTDCFEEDDSIIFQENEQIHPFIYALTFYETGECQNLFVQIHIPKLTNCHTLQPKNIFIHKMILNCLFIILVS